MTIDGEEYATMTQLAERYHVGYEAIKAWARRHNVERKILGKRIVALKVSDFADYQRAMRRK